MRASSSNAIAVEGQPIPVLVDESVTAQAEVSIGSGVRGTTVILSTADLLAALGDAPVVRLRSD